MKTPDDLRRLAAEARAESFWAEITEGLPRDLASATLRARLVPKMADLLESLLADASAAVAGWFVTELGKSMTYRKTLREVRQMVEPNAMRGNAYSTAGDLREIIDAVIEKETV